MARSFRIFALVTASCAALTLTGCNRASDGNAAGGTNMTSAEPSNSALPVLPAAVPLQSGPAGPIAPAPPVGALPVRRPVALARPADPGASYAYLDRAYGVADALGDAPPDYTYDDGGINPWVWQTAQGDAQYAEPVDGGYRYYYYQPGATQPYLVRDPDYSYAFAGAALVAIYAADGALVPYNDYGPRRDFASRYFWRGQALREAAAQREHRGVIAANWAARRADIDAARASWAEARARQADWAAYHDAHQAEEQAHWTQERQQRQLAARRFSNWQQTGGEGPQSRDRGPRVVLPAAGRQQPTQEIATRPSNLIAARQDAIPIERQHDRQQAMPRQQLAEHPQTEQQQIVREQAQARRDAQQQHARIEQQQGHQIEANRQAERSQLAEQRHERADDQRQAAQANHREEARLHETQVAEQHQQEAERQHAQIEARQQSQTRPLQAQHQAKVHAAPPPRPPESHAPPPEHHEAPHPGGRDRDHGRHG